jgi:hypothetical protein
VKRYRLTRKQQAGIGFGRVEDSVIELANDATPPEGAEQVADTEELPDWQPQVAAEAPHAPAPGSGGITNG